MLLPESLADHLDLRGLRLEEKNSLKSSQFHTLSDNRCTLRYRNGRCMFMSSFHGVCAIFRLHRRNLEKNIYNTLKFWQYIYIYICRLLYSNTRENRWKDVCLSNALDIVCLQIVEIVLRSTDLERINKYIHCNDYKGKYVESLLD
jgi:hypothetical protein